MLKRLLRRLGYVKVDVVAKRESRLNARVRFLEKENQSLLLKNMSLEYEVGKLKEERSLYAANLKRLEKRNEDAVNIMVAQERGFKKFFLNEEVR